MLSFQVSAIDIVLVIAVVVLIILYMKKFSVTFPDETYFKKVAAEEKKQEILAREKSEAKRYKKYYDIDLKDTSIYDLFIDSSNKTPEEIVKIITQKLEK